MQTTKGHITVSGSKNPGFSCSHFSDNTNEWSFEEIDYIDSLFMKSFRYTACPNNHHHDSSKSMSYPKGKKKPEDGIPVVDGSYGAIPMPFQMAYRSGTPPNKRKQTTLSTARRTTIVREDKEDIGGYHPGPDTCTKKEDCCCSACIQRRKLVAELLAEEESSKKKKQKKKKKKDKNGVKSTNTNNDDDGDDEKNKEIIKNLPEQFEEVEQEATTLSTKEEQETKNNKNSLASETNKKSKKKALRGDNKSASQTSDEATDLNTSELQHWIEMKNKYTIPNSPAWSLDEADPLSEEDGQPPSAEWMDDASDTASDIHHNFLDDMDDFNLQCSNDSSTISQVENVQLKARLLAIDAQEAFMHREMHGALQLITEAIELDPNEPVYYINRSFYYQQLQEFLKALHDVESALSLDESEVYLEHSLYSKANALIGLERFDQAETVLNRIRSLPNNANKFIPRLEKDLMLVRLKKLVHSDYTLPLARLYAFKYGSIKEALAALESHCDLLMQRNDIDLKLHLALIGSHNPEEEVDSLDEETLNLIYEDEANQFMCMHDDYDDDEIYFSEEEERDIFYGNSENWSRPKDILNKTIPEFEETREPPDPKGQKALWIGNVSPSCSVALVTHLFMKFGNVTFCKIFTNEKISDTSYLLLHYDNDLSPRLVMNYYKDKVVPGVSKDDSPLLIRFRNKNDKLEESYESPVLGLGNTLASPTSGTVPGSPGPTTTSSNSKSVYATECYYWRTTGCDRERCNFKHVPAHKGIDKQAWMRKKT